MRRLTRSAIPFTHRDIPEQIGLTFDTFDEMIINNGAIEESMEPIEYVFDKPMDYMDNRLLDQNSRF